MLESGVSVPMQHHFRCKCHSIIHAVQSKCLLSCEHVHQHDEDHLFLGLHVTMASGQTASQQTTVCHLHHTLIHVRLPSLWLAV